MGSGETAPTMIKVHRTLMRQPAVMLDTPYAFQVNVDDLTAKIREYFADSVGTPIDAAAWRRADQPVAERERTLATLSRAQWAFAGPGSPSYALGQWLGTPIPAALRDVVTRGGTVLLGSAAAVTAGTHAIPVYEIYKVGTPPHWLEGLDLLGALTGIRAAVVPHYDNREGGRHDTRYCYLGETRLAAMELDLPDDVGVLGVDEQTAAIVDLATATFRVEGSGGVTVRRRGRSEVIPAGSQIALADLARLVAGQVDATAVGAPEPTQVSIPEPDHDVPSLARVARSHRAEFDSCLGAADAEGALSACLELEAAIWDWSHDTLEGDDLDTARGILRAMLVELAGAAKTGLRDDRELLAPVVTIALAARQQARADKDFATSDDIRDRLLAAGIEVRDTPAGQEWDLAPA